MLLMYEYVSALEGGLARYRKRARVPWFAVSEKLRTDSSLGEHKWKTHNDNVLLNRTSHA
jgi:hypothetical protein